jgi:DDE_Tnp_1-associated
MTTNFPRLVLPTEDLLFDFEQLYRGLQRVPDRRKRRGRRYPLAVLLMIGVLAILADQDSSRAISHWAKLPTRCARRWRQQVTQRKYVKAEQNSASALLKDGSCRRKASRTSSRETEQRTIEGTRA